MSFHTQGLIKLNWDHAASGTLEYAGRAVWTHFKVKKKQQVPGCLGKGWNAETLRSSGMEACRRLNFHFWGLVKLSFDTRYIIFLLSVIYFIPLLISLYVLLPVPVVPDPGVFCLFYHFYVNTGIGCLCFYIL